MEDKKCRDHGIFKEYSKPPGKNPMLKKQQEMDMCPPPGEPPEPTAYPSAINNPFADFLGKKVECGTKDEISYTGALKQVTKNYIVLHNVLKIKTASREIILKEISKVLIFLEYIIAIQRLD